MNPVIYITFCRWYAIWSWAYGRDAGRRDDDMWSFGITFAIEEIPHD